MTLRGAVATLLASGLTSRRILRLASTGHCGLPVWCPTARRGCRSSWANYAMSTGGIIDPSEVSATQYLETQQEFLSTPEPTFEPDRAV
jgi:hypothetical protein